MNNKVKFNICNCHYALQKVSENGEMTFDTPVAMRRTGSHRAARFQNGVKPARMDAADPVPVCA